MPLAPKTVLQDILEDICRIGKIQGFSLRQLMSIYVQERNTPGAWWAPEDQYFFWRMYYIVRIKPASYRDTIRLATVCDLDVVRRIVDTWKMEALL